MALQSVVAVSELLVFSGVVAMWENLAPGCITESFGFVTCLQVAVSEPGSVFVRVLLDSGAGRWSAASEIYFVFAVFVSGNLAIVQRNTEAVPF